MEKPDFFYEDIEVGHEYWGSEEIADRDEMVAYGKRFDPWPMHVSEEAGRATPFGGLIASGGYSIGLWYRSGHAILNQPGKVWAFQGGFDWHVRFVKPVRPGDRVRLRLVVTEKRLTSKPGRGIVRSDSDLVDSDGESVLSIDVHAMVATRPG